ncbi:MAG: methyltransferase domain-containing protein [Myxococcales bacterium]|nr:methyltransferase domain-containing protein [Myxococcales bacterium]
MYEASLAHFCDPSTHTPLVIEATERDGDEILAGHLVCPASGSRYPIVNGIPRFVPAENYADGFGFEWQRFADLQTDSHQPHTITHDRFYAQVGLTPEELGKMTVLEAGCGGGRFSDVVLETGAQLFSFDLSNAVDKNREIHRTARNHHLAQASIAEAPFVPQSFDLVFCFGVIQHTPDPEGFFRSLIPFVKPGGLLCIDVYAAHPKQTSHWKYLVRPFTRHMDHETLLHGIERAAEVLVPISRQVRRIPVLGKPLSRFVPIFVHDGFMGKVPREDEVRHAVLETFDALSPAYDKPRSRRTLRRWFEKAGFEHIETFCEMNALNSARGRAPLA